MTHFMGQIGFPVRQASPRDGGPSGKQANAAGEPICPTAGRLLRPPGVVGSCLWWPAPRRRPRLTRGSEKAVK